MTICKTSIIDENCIIGENVTIGSFCIIGNCRIGDNCVIHSHVVIGDNVNIAEDVEIFEGAIIGKPPKGAGATSRPIEYEKSIIIRSSTSICPHAVIYYDVIVGSNCLIGDGASIREQCRIGNFCIISRYVTLNYNVKIGNYVKIMDLSHITGNTIIDDYAFISALVGTANDNELTGHYNRNIIGQWIREGAFIGLGADILPDIIIGEHAIVGAAALVTKNVGKEALVIGIPAKAV